MHTKEWQAVCGFITDACEALSETPKTMRGLFDLITESKPAVIYSWKAGGRSLYLRRDDFRRRTISVARKLVSAHPEKGGIIGLHVAEDVYWPILYWAVLMSGHIPLILDSRRELFDYRSLKDCQGVYCITEDKNYPWIIDPDSLKDSNSEVDSAFFDHLWEDRTFFVLEDAGGTLQIISHDGQSVCEQIFRLRYVYQYNQDMLYPPHLGPMRLLLRVPLCDFFGYLSGVILYPFYGGEVMLSPVSHKAEETLLPGQEHMMTHLCLSPEECEAVRTEIARKAKQLFPRDEERYIAWLNGEVRINDFRVLTRYQSISAKLKKRLLGKNIRCILCVNLPPDTSVSLFFSQFGVFFANGSYLVELGMISMELSCEPEARVKGSAGMLLHGVRCHAQEGDRIRLSVGEHTGKRFSNKAFYPLPDPFPVARKAAMNMHGRLCFIERMDSDEHITAAIDPQLIQKITEIYAEVLNKPAGIIKEDMDFFNDLGGDSLSYFLLLQHLEVVFNTRIGHDERAYFITVRYAAKTLVSNIGRVVANDA